MVGLCSQKDVEFRHWFTNVRIEESCQRSDKLLAVRTELILQGQLTASCSVHGQCGLSAIFISINLTEQLNSDLMAVSFRDNIQAVNTCSSISTSLLFIKSMNHTEHLKKQKFPKWYYSGGLWAHRGGQSLLFPSLWHWHCSSDRKQETWCFHIAKKWTLIL